MEDKIDDLTDENPQENSHLADAANSETDAYSADEPQPANTAHLEDAAVNTEDEAPPPSDAENSSTENETPYLSWEEFIKKDETLLLPAPPKPNIHTLGVIDLHKKFGKKEVVKGVDFFMQNGEVAGLLGPNGAGKTTIFYMIVGFYQPTQGVVKMNDADITLLPMYRRARMGIAYLPQEASIFRKLTVEQNIWAILESRQDITENQKKEKLESLLNEFNIGRIRKQFGYTLSGGERRRTEIARALATEPKFLLLDEPFAGIDPIAVYEIKSIIRRLAEKGIGILITDHNVRDTLEITKEAFIIAEGTIFAHGNKEDILNNEMVRKIYLGEDFRM